MAAPPIVSGDASDVAVETLQELNRSFALDRSVKTLLFIALFVITALLGQRAHAYLPIVLFALIADLMSLNRQRRLTVAVEAALSNAGRSVGTDDGFGDDD